MTTVNVDLTQLSGIDPETVNLSNARIDLSPYAAYADGDEWVTRNILRVKAPEGVATVDLPPTPLGNAYEVQERGFRGARHGYVLVPDQLTVEYVDLVWVDKGTLDPLTPPSPAWLAALEAVQASLALKVNSSTYTAGLALKQDVATLDTAIATFAETESLAVITTSPAGDITLEAFGA